MQVVTGEQNTILRTVSQPVKQITAELRKFALDMIKTMHAEKGVGIAAPQVGRNIRMVICMFNPGEKNEVIVPMVNPVILEKSETTIEADEGCLSLPKVWGKVKRADYAVVRYKNLKGQEQTLELRDYNARIIQHEVDHIDAVLFIDRASSLEPRAKKKKAAEES